jgi:EAL domain-containing protein (putative c-di-GMP-specific phosphodiesterase class I)
VEQATQLAELWRYGVARVQGEYFQAPSEATDYDFGIEHIEAGGVGMGWRGPQ